MPNETLPALFGLVGWHPVTPNQGELALPEPLTESRSALYVNDLNELLGLATLVHCAPEGEALGAFLVRLQTDALRKVTTRIMAEQGLTAKVLLDSAALVGLPGRAGDTVNKLGRFVGLRLKLRDMKGVAFSVPSLTLQLDAVLTTDLPVYVYSDAQTDPVQVLTIPAGANRANYPYELPLTGENALDMSFASQPGTYAYIGYYEDDLPLGTHAIRREFTGENSGCGTCAEAWRKWKDYVAARAFTAPVGTVGVAPAPDQLTLQTETYGLNLTLSAACVPAGALDMAANQLLLAEVVQLALGIRFLEALISSPNLTQVTQREAVQADALALLYTCQARLYGGKEQGTDNYYPSLLKSVKLDFSGLDAACLPQPVSRLSMGGLTRN